MKRLLISSAAVALLFVGCNQTPSNSNETVTNKTVTVDGIRKAALTKDSQNLAKIEYINQAPRPGKVKLFKTSYVTAPPMIPHSIEGMTPIKIGHNQCLTCHKPKMAKAMHIISIPQDHFVNNFANSNYSATAKNTKYKFVKQNKLAGSRYNCTQCHAPQAKLDPVIENRFESLKNAQLAK